MKLQIRKFLCAIAGVLALAVSPVAEAASISLVSSNDTYIRDGRSHAANGTTDNLDFRFDFSAYFQFDMSNLIINNITDATLTLHKIANVRNDTIVTPRVDAYGLPNLAGNTLQHWDELADFDPGDATNGLDFRNVGNDWTVGDPGAQAAFLTNLDQDNGALVTETAVNDRGDGTGVYTISGPDLVTFLNTRAIDGGLATFVMEATDAGGRGWGWATKEHADSSLHPTLDLVFDGQVPEPTSCMLLGLAGIAGLTMRKRSV